MTNQPEQPKRPMTPEEFFGTQQQKQKNIAQPQAKQASVQKCLKKTQPQVPQQAQVKKIVPPIEQQNVEKHQQVEGIPQLSSAVQPSETQQEIASPTVENLVPAQRQENPPVQQAVKVQPQQTILEKHCPYCGEVVPANILKCKHCGEWLVERYGHSWVKTMLLCGALGLFGVHNFYNGKTGVAVAQLILSLTFIGLFVSIPWVTIEYFMILHDAYTDSKGLKLGRRPTIGGCATFCALGILGGAGLHRFYTKQYALAWLQMLTLGGLLIWTVIDFVLILCGKFKDAQGNYIRG